ncbi:MAG TPA: YraN family protein [Rhizomicrobium sp.]
MPRRSLAIRRKAEQRGRRSEIWAALLLLAKFYRILGWRVRTPLGEIDLIARTPNGLICFIEVKARGDSLSAAQSLGGRQQGRIARAAMHYLAQHPKLAGKGMRFDVIAVAPGKFPRHYRNAWRDE